MTQENTPPISWEQQKLAAGLANAYLSQKGEELVEPDQAVPIVKECTQKIQLLLTDPQTAAELSPALKRRHQGMVWANERQAGLFRDRLAILFEPDMTVRAVAEAQGVPTRAVRESLRFIFRRLAVIESETATVFQESEKDTAQDESPQTPDTSLREDGLCRLTNSRNFSSGTPRAIEAAKNLCALCLVRPECFNGILARGGDVHQGVRGGLTAQERQAFRLQTAGKLAVAE